MNALTVYPYLLRNTWVFDDAQTGLKEEAFVAGITEIMSALVEHKNIQDAALGFALHFSDEPFDGFDVQLDWEGTQKSPALPGEDGSASGFGNWYKGVVAGQEMKGWLCPALGLYFHKTPPQLCVKAEPLPHGVDPIWRNSRDRGRRFFSAPGAD